NRRRSSGLGRPCSRNFEIGKPCGGSLRDSGRAALRLYINPHSPIAFDWTNPAQTGYPQKEIGGRKMFARRPQPEPPPSPTPPPGQPRTVPNPMPPGGPRPGAPPDPERGPAPDHNPEPQPIKDR